MQESSIRHAVNFASECGPRTNAIVQLKLDENGDIQINCDAQIMQLCFLKECLEGFIKDSIDRQRQVLQNAAKTSG